MAKRKATPASKLGFEGTEFTTIDGRKLDMGDYFKPDDFCLDEKDQPVILHDGMQRVLFDLFNVTERTAQVHQCPDRNNEWCATVEVKMVVWPKGGGGDVRYFTWSAVADCRKGNAMPGMERYTTAVAETRASGRVIRRLLGLEAFCTREELNETTIAVEDDTGPCHPSQLVLLQNKFLGDPKLNITMETVNKRLKRKEKDDNYLKTEEDLKNLKFGEAAELIQKLQRYDIEGAKE